MKKRLIIFILVVFAGLFFVSPGMAFNDDPASGLKGNPSDAVGAEKKEDSSEVDYVWSSKPGWKSSKDGKKEGSEKDSGAGASDLSGVGLKKGKSLKATEKSSSKEASSKSSSSSGGGSAQTHYYPPKYY